MKDVIMIIATGVMNKMTIMNIHDHLLDLGM